ncbi:uncharacterized protein LOC110422824 [Herrania umbratica]|uniref:Uncharacterized protein LOC110422824 n=1 Tax=Herrania umbratica TaxID=108875 RepID=A0A6J1B046_9ROSI|nr:uncharacterized protein LOC110422824 [Herrania umbratica]
MGQIKTGPSVSEPHHQVQAEPEPQCQAVALLHEPTQNPASATIYQTQRSTRANEALPQQRLQQQRYQPQPNQQAYGVVQPAAPPVPSQFPPQTAQNTGPNQHQDVVPPQFVVMPPYIHGTVSQIGAASGFPVPVEGWKTGLFDCMDDPMNALITVCFPCLTFGRVAEIVDEGHTSCGTSGLLYGLIAFFIGVPCILSCAYRTKLRNKLGLVESPAPDWVTHCFCDWCALCQEYRELQQRGWDPSIGWHGNLAKRQSIQQQQHLAMMPPMNQSMQLERLSSLSPTSVNDLPKLFQKKNIGALKTIQMNNPGLSDDVDATDAEIEVANILLELSRLWIEPVVSRWGFRGRRSALEESLYLSDQSIPPPMADYAVSSQLETLSCNGENKNEDSKLATDQHVPYIEEKYASEHKVEPPDLEPTTPCNSQNKVTKIKFNPSSEIRCAQKHIQIENKPPKLEADVHPEDVTVMKKTSNKRDKEEFEEGLSNLAVPKGCLVPQKEELENEVAFWEEHKRQLLESIEKVKDYLEKRKALNLRLKALKLQGDDFERNFRTDS